MKHTARWFPQFVLGLIVFVIIINVLGAAVAPYLPLIGKLVATALVILIVAAIGIVLFFVGRFVLGHIEIGRDDEM